MLQRAAREHDLDLQRSFVVGDRYGDVELAHGTGSRGVLVRTGYGEDELRENSRERGRSSPTLLPNDLAAAVDWILRQTK